MIKGSHGSWFPHEDRGAQRQRKIDPVGACVGMRGSRVKNIVRELNNEKVDIIRWSADERVLSRSAQAGKIKSITLDEGRKPSSFGSKRTSLRSP
jgi:transcription antitermination factor NusA-like protein